MEAKEKEWISVKDRLPENNVLTEVICTIQDSKKTRTVFPLTWRINKFMFFDGGYTDFTSKVTHWMLLPQPPKV